MRSLMMMNSQKTGFCLAVLIAFSLVSTSVTTLGWAQEVLEEKEIANSDVGFASEKPNEGQFVELPDGRFMVPYKVTVPGSEIEFEMIPIPGGTVKVGSPESEEGRNDDEGPQVEIAVKPIWMGKHEVTWAEYKLYMRMDEVFKAFNSDGVRQVTEETKIDAVTAPSGLYDPSFTYDAGDEPEQPAATMTQFAAKQYTKWLSGISGGTFRLPTDAEWEHACRAGTTTAYYFGDDPSVLEEYAWFDDNADYERHAVGELKPNAWGLYDMLGNVAEWVLDQHSEEGLAGLKERAADDLPVNWPTKADQRCVRGGSWEGLAEECRSASRFGSNDEDWKIEDPNLPQSPWWYTTEPATGVGFRIIRPLETPSREAMAKFWESDHASITRTVRVRIDSYGKGSLGIADPELPTAMKKD